MLIFACTAFFLFFFVCVLAVANSPGGCAHGRDVELPDWVMDYWDPKEKAQYPDYFARREQRKKEYEAWWNKNYGNWYEEQKKHEDH